MHEMRWVAPSTVAQVRFVEWTAEGRLRHASYLGLRSDKDPREVVREGLAS
jgi:bifunctional non-homologous end joining protein LigD